VEELAVETQSGAVLPWNVRAPNNRISISSEAVARGASHCYREAGAYISAHFGVRSVPFGGK
jgi:hypothetical protein